MAISRIKVRSRYSLSRAERITKRAEFKRVINLGKSVGNEFLVIYTLCQAGTRRVGFIVPQRIGKPAKRVQIKRRLREIYRLNRACLIDGVNLVIIARPPSLHLKFHEFERVFLSLCKKAGILSS